MPLRDEELRSLERLTARLAHAGLIAKALFFGGLFWWAATSELGAGALQGAVAADFFTWIVLSLLDWPFRGYQVRVGTAFEVVLLLLYVFRGSLFSIPAGAEPVAVAFLAFLAFAGVKLSVWGVQQALESSGVTEPGWP